MSAALTTAAWGKLLDLLFTNVDWANIGDASGLQNSATDGVFYISLHTSSPGSGGSQNTNEAAYTSYARQSIVRTTSGWTTTGANIVNDGIVNFPMATGGSETLTHWGLGTDSSGAGNLIAFGALTSSVSIATGEQPSIAASAFSLTGSVTLA